MMSWADFPNSPVQNQEATLDLLLHCRDVTEHGILVCDLDCVRLGTTRTVVIL